MAKLIVIDKSKNITYFGGCRVQFHGIQKYLNLKMFNEDETVLSISFDYNFIKKQNFLCAFDDDENNDKIMVIFGKAENCVTIFNAIVKAKNDNQFFDREKFKSSFLIPMIDGIKSGISEYMDLRSVILDFVNSLDNDERLLWLTLLAEILLTPSSIQAIKDDEDDTAIDVESSGNPNLRKRSFNSNTSKEFNDDGNASDSEIVLPKRVRFSLPSSSTSNPSYPGAIFDIVEYWDDGILNKRLLLFTSAERRECYEYYFVRGQPYYRCVECVKEKRFVDIKFTVDEEGRKTYHFDAPQNHICKPLEYSPESYGPSLIVKSPNFEFTDREFHKKMYSSLIIYDPEDRSIYHQLGYRFSRQNYYCFQCKKQKIHFAAQLIDYEGEDAIELVRAKHVCK